MFKKGWCLIQTIKFNIHIFSFNCGIKSNCFVYPLEYVSCGGDGEMTNIMNMGIVPIISDPVESDLGPTGDRIKSKKGLYIHSTCPEPGG